MTKPFKKSSDSMGKGVCNKLLTEFELQSVIVPLFSID